MIKQTLPNLIHTYNFQKCRCENADSLWKSGYNCGNPLAPHLLWVAHYFLFLTQSLWYSHFQFISGVFCFWYSFNPAIFRCTVLCSSIWVSVILGLLFFKHYLTHNHKTRLWTNPNCFFIFSRIPYDFMRWVLIMRQLLGSFQSSKMRQSKQGDT